MTMLGFVYFMLSWQYCSDVSVTSYTCNVCSKKFRFSSWYKNNVATHDVVGLFNCNYCPKHFKRKDNLNRHFRTHFGAETHDCEVCGEQFSYSFNLKQHIHVQHNPNFKRKTCRKCGKTLVDARALRYHDNRIHTLLRPFKCNCGAAFHAPNDLYRYCRKEVI